MKRFSKLAIFYVWWMIILTAIPLTIMVIISFMDIRGLKFEDAVFSTSHFNTVFSKTYFTATLTSLKLASLATIGSLLLGYPIAYIVSSLKSKNKFLILLLFILPMWTNLLLRVETINRLLKPEGILKNLLGISLDLAGSEIAVIITMILIYLPFMILPIYTVLEKNDKHLLEASMDLGANPISSFFKVTLPLSLKGISTGVTMVFLPCAMGFTIPEIISGGNMQLIGTIIEGHFKKTNSYNTGSLTSLLLIIVVFGALFFISKIDEEGETLI